MLPKIIMSLNLPLICQWLTFFNVFGPLTKVMIESESQEVKLEWNF